MISLRQSTASQEVPLGYFLDSTDGNTEETGLTIANTDIKIWKAGATTLANKNSGGATHISNGIYYAVLDATDTDTIGSLVIFVHVSGALAVRLECVVLDEAVYDVQFGTTAPATTGNLTSSTVGTVTTLTNLPAITSNWLTAAGIAASALNGKGDWNIGKTGYALSAAGIQAIWDALTSALTTVGSIGKRIADYLDVAVSSRASQTSLDTMAGDTSTGITGIKNQTDQFTFSTGGVDANVAAIGGDTTPAGNLQADYNGTGYNKTNSEIFAVTTLPSLESVLSLYFSALTRKTAGLAGDIASVFAAINQDYGSGAGTYNNTTDSLEAVRDRGDAAWTTGSGSSDWTATEKEHIRYRLQIDGTQTAPAADGPTQLPVDIQAWVGETPNPLVGGRVDAILGAFLIDESRVDAACTEGGQTQSFTTNLTETEDDYYAGWVFMFTDAGTNRAVPRVVRLYNGTTKEITLVTPLPANTTNGHAFALIALTTGAELTDGSMALNKGYTATAVLDAEQAGFLTPGTIGESINEAATNTQDIQSRLPAALVSGRMASDVIAVSGDTTAADNMEADYDGTGYNKSASTIGTATALSSTERNNIADALLKRDFAAVTGEAARSVLNALRFLRNKWSVSGTTLTVTKEDDTTSAWTATVTTDAAADPVTGSDPA